MWTKVVAPTILVSVLWVMVSGGTTYYINWLFKYHARALKENVATIEAAAGIQDVVWRLQALAIKAAATHETELQPRTTQLEAEFQRYFSRAQEAAATAEQQSLVREIGVHFTIYLQTIQGGLAKGNSRSTGSWGRLEDTIRLAHSVTQPCEELLEANERLLNESTARGERLSSTVILVRLAFLVAGPAIGILFGVLVARGLHRSISQISITLKGATGELSRELGRVDIGRTSDLADLEKQVQAVSMHIKKVVEELHDARQEMIRAERLAAVGELAAGVAHELRNPLTSVKLLIQTAAQRYPERTLTDRQYQVIQEEVARMEKTIQGLLDFARPPQLHRLRHDIRDTLGRALNLMGGPARHARVVLSKDLPSQPVLVEGDPEQLHQVFINLLLNAIESMSQGGALSVAVEPHGNADATCRVLFSDSGPGIPDAVMGRIFEPFVTSKERGTGLGLAVSRRIIEEHGGRLTGANRPDGGAMFVVELPMCARDRDLCQDGKTGLAADSPSERKRETADA